jgi:hypothetical protein
LEGEEGGGRGGGGLLGRRGRRSLGHWRERKVVTVLKSAAQWLEGEERAPLAQSGEERDPVWIETLSRDFIVVAPIGPQLGLFGLGHINRGGPSYNVLIFPDGLLIRTASVN